MKSHKKPLSRSQAKKTSVQHNSISFNPLSLEAIRPNSLSLDPVTLVSFYKRDFSNSFTTTILNKPEMQAITAYEPEYSNPDLQESVKYSRDGLNIEFVRPIVDDQGKTINKIVGVFVVLPLWSEALRKIPYFMLVARFRNPKLKENPNNSSVTFASGVAMNLKINNSAQGKLYGATSRFNYNPSSNNFNPNTASNNIVQELNILGITNSDNIQIDNSDFASFYNTSEIFTVTSIVERTSNIANFSGELLNNFDVRAGLHINPNDTTPKNYITEFKNFHIASKSEPEITDFRVGLGTISPETYKVSVDILDFEVFVPSEFIERNRADYKKAQGIAPDDNSEVVL